jgi:hypothetical protein
MFHKKAAHQKAAFYFYGEGKTQRRFSASHNS